MEAPSHVAGKIASFWMSSCLYLRARWIFVSVGCAKNSEYTQTSTSTRSSGSDIVSGQPYPEVKVQEAFSMCVGTARRKKHAADLCCANHDYGPSCPVACGPLSASRAGQL